MSFSKTSKTFPTRKRLNFHRKSARYIPMVCIWVRSEPGDLSALFGLVYVCVCEVYGVCVCKCSVMWVGVKWVYGFFVIRVCPRWVYCLLLAVKIHIEDHSVSSRVIFTKEGWMEGWKRPRGKGGGGAGRAAKVDGAPLKIPIDWLISLEQDETQHSVPIGPEWIM